MDFFECVQKRTSIRKYKQDPILIDDLKRIISTVRIGPSAANLQPLEYIIINKQDICDQLFPHTSWAGYLKPSWTPKPHERPTAYISIVNTQPSNPYVDFDVGIAMAYITLAAQALKIGSCILCKLNREQIKKLLFIPEEFEIKALISLGKKNEEVNRLERENDVKYWRDEHQIFYVPKKPLASIIHEQIYPSI